MARIASLNVLLDPSGKDFLAEQYGGVVANVQKGLISSLLKNKDLSGSPTAGTLEAKRFANRASQTYGTARTAGKGKEVTAKPVTVSIDQDKELITEVQEKDVALYGIDNFITRQVALDEKSMARDLEKAFFAQAVSEGTAFTTATTAIEAIMEELIQKVETVSNAYVEGVPRDMISIVCSTAIYGQLRAYLDGKANANVDTGAAEFGLFHGVKIYPSVYLPATAKAIAMVDGAIAQPVRPVVAPAEKVQMSNAYAFGLFYSYGTKAVMPDLIFKWMSA